MEHSEILEPIHACLRELLEKEKNNSSPDIKYTDTDVVAVTLLYSLVLGNRLYHSFREEKVGIAHAQHVSEYFSQLIQQTTHGMSQVSVKGFYNAKGKKQ